MIIKPLDKEITLTATGSNVNNATLVRVSNVNGSANLVLAYANGLPYADITVDLNTSVILQKAPTDLLIGTQFKAGRIAYKG